MPQGLIPSLEPFYNAFEQLCKKSQDGVWTGDIYAIRKALASHGVHDRNVTIRLNSLQLRGMLTVATQKLSHKKVIWTVKLNCEVKEMETPVQTGTTATTVPCTVSTDWIGPWIQGIYQERDEALARNRELEAKVTAMAEENVRLRTENALLKGRRYSVVHSCDEAEKQISALEAENLDLLKRMEVREVAAEETVKHLQLDIAALKTLVMRMYEIRELPDPNHAHFDSYDVWVATFKDIQSDIVETVEGFINGK